MTAWDAWDGRVIGPDGKSYPYHKTVGDDRLRIIGFEHELSHAGQSVRRIQAALAEQGIRRSVGTIFADLKNWRCRECPVQVARMTHLNTATESAGAR